MTPRDYLKKPYTRLVVPENDGSYRAEIAEFPGCIALGDSAASALAELDGVAETWLESVIARGQQVPQPMEEAEYSGKLVLRLPKSLHRRAAFAAQRDGVSLNQFIVNSVSEQVGIRAAVTQVFSGTAVSLVTAPLQLVQPGQYGRVNNAGIMLSGAHLVMAGAPHAGR